MARTDKVPRKRLDPDDRHATILLTALDMFEVRSYAEVKIAQIAAAVQATDSLIYRYFGSKEDPYVEVLQTPLDQLMETPLKALADLSPGVPTRNRLGTITLTHLEHVARNKTGGLSLTGSPGSEPPAAAVVRHMRSRSGWPCCRICCTPASNNATSTPSGVSTVRWTLPAPCG